MRRLEDALKRLRDAFEETKRLALGSEEAAAKCQVRMHAVLVLVGLLEAGRRSVSGARDRFLVAMKTCRRGWNFLNGRSDEYGFLFVFPGESRE